MLFTDDLTEVEKVEYVRSVLHELFDDARAEEARCWNEDNKADHDEWAASANAYCVALSLIDRAFPEIGAE